MPITRANTSDPDDWGDPPTPTPTPVLLSAAMSASITDNLETLLSATDALFSVLVIGYAADQAADLAGDTLASFAATIQDARRTLAVVEAHAVRALAQIAGEGFVPSAGVLPDGRPYEVMQGSVRKAWKHEEWQHDVRGAVARAGRLTGTIVDAETGEAVDVFAAMEAVQAAHGAAAPRVTALKALGLAAADYCETFAGAPTLKVTTTEGKIL